jgi:uncharacterized membrane-anchored protein YjiN (DUF445 family)
MAELREVTTGLGMRLSQAEKPKSVEEHIADYVKGTVKAEEEIKVLREHLRDFKKSFIENSYLTKAQVKLLEKAKKLIKDNSDIDKLVDMVGKIRGTKVDVGGEEGDESGAN